MFLLLLASLSLNVFSSEVITLAKTTPNQDLRFIMTDSDLSSIIEKSWNSHPCKLRWSSNILGQKEYVAPESCRAELMKIFLNAGYRPLDRLTFIK